MVPNLSLSKPKVIIEDKQYKILNQIGEGGFAFVYRVEPCTPLGGITSAVSAVVTGNTNMSGSANGSQKVFFAVKKMICQTPEQLKEAQKEIRLLKEIQHPNVLPLLGSTITRNDKKHFEEVLLLLPLYVGSVQGIIDKGAMAIAAVGASGSTSSGRPSMSAPTSCVSHCGFEDALDVVKIIRHSVSGLMAVHEAGYRHGDFKPANILLKADMTAVITDFGSASKLRVEVNNRHDALAIQEEAALFTTAPFRAPELFNTPNKCVIDGKSDVWSCGCVLYAMFFSRTPFESASEGFSPLAVNAGHYQIPEGHPWPSDYIDSIANCLKVDLAERFTIEELMLALKRLSSPPSDLSFQPKASASTSEKTTTHPHSPSSSRAQPSSPSSLATKKSNVATTHTDNNNSNNNNSNNKSNIQPFNADFSSAFPAPPPPSEPTPLFEANFANHFDVPPPSIDPQAATGETTKVSCEDDFEFGDFETANTTTTATATVTATSSGKKNVDESAFVNVNANSNANESVDEDMEAKARELTSQIMKEAFTPSDVIKEDLVYVMRPRGFPKTMVRKKVSIVLTASGLIVRKITDGKDERKVHYMLCTRSPISLTASDSTVVGNNGLILQGMTPLSFFSDHAGEGRISEGNEGDGGVSNGNASGGFTQSRFQIAFENKDILNSWMDAIDQLRESMI